jgi:multiple sugar transport system ATP-binding protein
MAEVEFSQVTCWYAGSDGPAVDNLDLKIDDGEFMVLVGPSGCGKTTSLRALAGLETCTRGAIRIGGRDVTQMAPKERDIAMVFQSYALYPHMTVEENMGFALKIAHRDKPFIAEQVGQAARLLDLEALMSRRPKALSGGQRQRVAMGRAIVRDPQVYLMDEPLSNLDAKLRVQTRTQIAQMQRRLGVTTVYVTHDQTEAMTMGDRVAVMNGGVLQQVSSPDEIYRRPRNTFVAGFIGSPPMNLLTVEVSTDGVALAGQLVAGGAEIGHRISAAYGPRVIMGIRPEDMRAAGSDQGFPVVVDAVERLGADSFVYGAITDSSGSTAPLVARVDGRTKASPGDLIRLAFDWEHSHFFEASSGARIDDSLLGRPSQW